MSVKVIKLDVRRFNVSAGPIVRGLLAAAWSEGAKVVALDFADVASIDSMGVSVLISEHRKRPEGTKIVFCSINDYIREVFEITQLVRIFDVYASAEAVVESLTPA